MKTMGIHSPLTRHAKRNGEFRHVNHTYLYFMLIKTIHMRLFPMGSECWKMGQRNLCIITQYMFKVLLPAVFKNFLQKDHYGLGASISFGKARVSES